MGSTRIGSAPHRWRRRRCRRTDRPHPNRHARSWSSRPRSPSPRAAGKAPPTVAPSDTATATPTARPGGVRDRARSRSPSDAWLVAGRSGAMRLQVILASTGERIFDFPIGVPERDWSQSGQRRHDRGIDDGLGPCASRSPRRRARRSTARGACRPSASTRRPSASPTTARRSSSSRTGDSRRRGGSQSRFAIVDRTRRGKPRIVELAGAFEYDALSPDGSILYVVEHLAGPPDGHYQVRALDTATGILRDGGRRRQEPGSTRRWPAGRSPRPATRRHGLHALPRRGAPVHPRPEQHRCLGVVHRPAGERRRRAAAASDWGLTATTDGTLDRRRERDARPGGRHPAVGSRGPPERDRSPRRRLAASRWPSSATRPEGRSVVASSPPPIGVGDLRSRTRRHRPPRRLGPGRQGPLPRGRRGRRDGGHAGRRDDLCPAPRRWADRHGSMPRPAGSSGRSRATGSTDWWPSPLVTA